MRYVCLTICACYVLAFAVYASAQPSEYELQKAFASSLSAGWILKDFNVKVSENYGTKVEPLWKYRFNAGVQLAVDTYIRDGYKRQILFLKKGGHKGQKEKLYGIATVWIHTEKWRSSFKLDETPLARYGKPKSSYEGRTIIRGSSEEKGFMALLLREEELRRKAAEERRRAEEEKRKQQKLAREKREHEARLAREKRKRSKKLIYAIDKKTDVSVVKKLLQEGVNLEQKDYNARTPLMRAARYGHVEVVRLLLKAGAAINYKNHFRATALDWAKMSKIENRTTIIEILRSAGGKSG